MAAFETIASREALVDMDRLLTDSNIFRHFEPLVHTDDLHSLRALTPVPDRVSALPSSPLAVKITKRKRIGNTLEKPAFKQNQANIPAAMETSVHAQRLLSATFKEATEIQSLAMKLLRNTQVSVIHREMSVSEINELRNAVMNDIDSIGELGHSSEKILNKIANRKLEPAEQYFIAKAVMIEMKSRDYLQTIAKAFESPLPSSKKLNVKHADNLESAPKIANAEFFQTKRSRLLAPPEEFRIALEELEVAQKKLFDVQEKVVGHPLTLYESNELRNAIVDEIQTKELTDLARLIDVSEYRSQLFEKLANRKLTREDLSQLKKATEKFMAWKKMRFGTAAP